MSELQEHINKEVDDTLKDHAKHLLIANEEMGVIKTDIAWLKRWADNLDYKLWAIILALLTALIKLFVK